jgi:membrane protease YdiL (CAAX protease family)
MGVTAIVLLIVAKTWQYFGSVKILDIHFTPKGCLQGLGLAAVTILSSGLLYRLWPSYRHSADAYLDLVLRPLLWPDLIWLGLLPGLSEELLFRGVMLPALGADWLAIIVSSLIFGILHFSGRQQWPYVIWAAIVGLALAYSALASGNLLVPIVAHVTTNFVASLIWKFNHLNSFPST